MAEINEHRPSTESFMQPKRLLAGLGWNTVGQFLVVGISLGLTPFLLHHLGATQYGIFALVSSVRGLLSNLDGGLGPTGYRYFPVYVGRGNVAITTSFLLTMLTLVAIIVGAETTTMILFAPAAVRVFALGSGLAGHSHETAQLIRFLMPALFIAAIRTPIQRLVMAHHRWAFLNYTQVMAVVVYAATTVVVSYETSGLQCLIWATYAQEAVLLITAAWACRRYISLKRLRWLPISEVRQDPPLRRPGPDRGNRQLLQLRGGRSAGGLPFPCQVCRLLQHRGKLQPASHQYADQRVEPDYARHRPQLRKERQRRVFCGHSPIPSACGSPLLESSRWLPRSKVGSASAYGLATALKSQPPPRPYW